MEILKEKNISHQFNSDYFTEKAHKENLRHRLGSKATVATKEKCSKCKVDWISREARDSRGSAKPCGLKKEEEEEEENIRKEKSSIVCEAAKIGFIFLQYFFRQIFIFFGWVTTFDTLTNFRNYFSGFVGGWWRKMESTTCVCWRSEGGSFSKVAESTNLDLTKCALWNDCVWFNRDVSMKYRLVHTQISGLCTQVAACMLVMWYSWPHLHLAKKKMPPYI